MKKVELLSPVGNMATLPFAIHNGADAVYLSGKKFGARKFADNFDEEEIVQAIKYAHLYGVKVYVTVNTLVFDDEIEEVSNYIEFLYRSGVDALIMQDIGLIELTHKKFPNLEIHASTQCHNHNLEGIKIFENMGVKRVVLDREMSLEEIKRLNTNLEKEVFVHGALCVSYSGCCLFSSLNGGRSGNRGECVASCRKQYELYKNDQKLRTDGDYLLSTRELNTLGRVKELIEAGISSFKIEGRMKSAEYVGYVTKLYRMMIDKYYNHEDMTLSETDLKDLKKLYNRGFTEGYLFGKSGRELMNIKSPNHIGIPLGNVLEYDSKYIKIKLIEDIKQEDGIRLPNGEGMIVNRLYNDKLLLVNSLEKGQIAIVDNNINLKEKGVVLKTIDKLLIDDLKKYIPKKMPIDISITCRQNQPIKLEVTDYENTIGKSYSLVQEAKSSPTFRERIVEQVSKLGNTPFVVNRVVVDIDDNIFVPIKDLNELRRMVIEELISTRENKGPTIVIKEEDKQEKITKDETLRINALVRNEQQLLTCLANDISLIYTDDRELYKKYRERTNIYLRLPRVLLQHPDLQKERLVVTEIGSVLKYSANNEVIADYTLNVTNDNSVRLLEKNNIKMVTLSPEITPERLGNINFQKDNVEYIVYGTMELMIMKYCPVKMLDNNDQNNCNLCSLGNHYYLKDKNDNIYPILNTKHYTHIMHKEPLDNIAMIKECRRRGISNFRIELFDETEEEIEYIIKKIKKELGD